MAPSSDISFEEIRQRAYEIWDRNHRPEGLEIQFWLLAEREIRSERDRHPTASAQAGIAGSPSQ